MFHTSRLTKTTLALFLSLAAGSALAAITPQQAEQLKTTLTPLGAERAGNAGRDHPGLEPAVSPRRRQATSRVSITRTRMRRTSRCSPSPRPTLNSTRPTSARVRSRCSTATPTPSRCRSIPLVVRARRRSGCMTTPSRMRPRPSCSRAGPVLPMPMAACRSRCPRMAIEVLWNHITRYRGIYVVRRASEAPVQRNGSFALVTSQQEGLFNYYRPGGQFADLKNILFYYLAFVKSPARLAGGAALIHETLDQLKDPRQAWVYDAGQRRVRRAPNLAYDTPIASSDGLRTADDTDLFNGSPDRYDWKLKGKQEVYIPYNNYKVGSPEVKYAQLLTPGHLNPQFTRYELHRVWVVEGTLKPGSRHIYSKRVLFLDEDSWGAALVDQYDGRGELWRVSMAYLKNFYDLPTTWSALDVFHDLQARRYYVQNLDNEEPATVDFAQPVPEDAYFMPSALRQRGTR